MKTVTLRDGAQVTLRPIRPEDGPDLTALYARLSRETAYQRFFSVMAGLPADWARSLANVDCDQRMAIVAVDPRNELIGVTRYARDADGEAEIAIAIQDAWQERGLGSILLGELLAYAETRGIRRFRAYVLADNSRMLRLLARVTRVLERKTEQGVISLLLVPRSGPAEPAG